MKKTDFFAKNITSYVITLAKWLSLSILVGLVSGYLGSFFHISIDYATKLRGENPWILFLLPLGGLLIVYFYKSFKNEGKLDTNRVLLAASQNEDVPLILAPLIFVGTVLTHLFGGSAGREGAALQLGGTIGGQVGRLFSLKDGDRHIIVRVGMSAVFAALFGTPLTAAVFSLEVCSVGVMQYISLVPCVVSASVAAYVAKTIGLSPVYFPIDSFGDTSILNILRVLVLIIGAAMVAMLFCYSMKKCEALSHKYLPNPYIRVFAGGALIVVLSLIFGRDYNGAGMNIVEKALSGDVHYEAFILKLIFTVITISAGFKGGEIVPAFFIGSTFGCAFAHLIGLDPVIGAAIGFVAVFCSVVNCPLASIILAIEVFGTGNIIILAISASISYMMSGYCGLYSAQRIVFSKLSEQETGVKDNGTKEVNI